MERISILHVGSNTTRMVVYEISEDGFYKLIKEQRETIRIRTTVCDDFYIEDDTIESLIFILKSFEKFSKIINATKIITVVNDSITNSKNHDIVLNKIKENTNLEITILSKEIKENFDALAIISSFDVKDSLVLDISGSDSTLLHIVDNKVIDKYTLDIGAVNISYKFSLSDFIGTEDFINARDFVKSKVDLIPWIKNCNSKNIITIGGNVKNIIHIDKYQRRYPLDAFHNYEMNLDEIKHITNLLKSKNLVSRRSMPGLSNDRADIIVAASLILQIVMEEFEISDLVFSSKGVRDGLIRDYVDKSFNCIDSPIDQSIKTLIYYHNISTHHANKIYYFFLKLFNSLANHFHFDIEDFHKIIKVSSLLLDAGNDIRYYNNNKNTFYVIVNSEINEMSHREVIISAYITYFNISSSFQGTHLKYLNIISRLDLKTASKLSVLLKIANSLDIMHNDIVKDIVLDIDDDKFIIDLISNDDCSYEKLLVSQIADEFFENTDLKLEVK